MTDWESKIAGIRMVVDQEFADRVQASSLSSQQWNVVMMAVDFEIENPGTPADARLVADTSKLPNVIGEIERIGEQSPPGGSSGDGSDDGGLIGGVLSSLGLGGGTSNEKVREEATRLADEYAEELRAKLIERGRWESVCEEAASG